MAKLQKLEAEVAALPPKELQRFRSWFDSFALADYEAGKCKPV